MGVGELGEAVEAGPGRTICLRGGNRETKFLRMQLWRPQLSRRRQQIMGGTISFRLLGGEEHILIGRGRRCPCNMFMG